MGGYNQIKLSDMLEALGEERTQSILSEFSCPVNKDIEDFIRHKAIPFLKQGISVTTLVFTSYKDEDVLIGYYALCHKILILKNNDVSKTLWSRIKKFGTINRETNACHIPAPLIGQLGKNFYNGFNKLITGNELLQMAVKETKIVHSILGGKIIYLECEDDKHLIDFYKRNDFQEFARRPLDRDESNIKGDILIQMLCYL